MSEQKLSILKLVNQYRECVRSIWNIYFLDSFQLSQDWDWALLDSFNRIKEELFQSIVLTSVLGETMPDFSLGFPSNRIRIVPSENMPWDIPVMINRTKGEIGGYWDHPITKINSHADLLFVNFFDWNPYGFIDMSRVVAEISDYPENPNLIGYRLIVELIYIDIILTDFKK